MRGRIRGGLGRGRVGRRRVGWRRVGGLDELGYVGPASVDASTTGAASAAGAASGSADPSMRSAPLAVPRGASGASGTAGSSGSVGAVTTGSSSSPMSCWICARVIAPSRTMRTRPPAWLTREASTMVEAAPPAAPPSRKTSTDPPSWSTASWAVAAAGCPVLLADETASGPVSARSSSAKEFAGMRSATVPRVSPRSQTREGCATRITVRPPGQNSSARRRTTSGTKSARASSVDCPGMSTGGGASRPRPFASSRRCTASGLKASAAMP
ncbi:hypothetical protein CMMCAS02_06220 [Clavibacter michiganensis subsp. michiganensis]|nr:hypothetical protein CMMCAS02_06220 [Clavibacter michiganensis subsp. michiganensis]